MTPKKVSASGGTVVVTGAGGFVGSAIVRSLVSRMGGPAHPVFEDGAPVRHVIALIRPRGSTRRLDEVPVGPHWNIESADLHDTVRLDPLLRQFLPRAIIHSALDPSAFAEVPRERRQDSKDAPPAALFRVLGARPNSQIITVGSAAVLEPSDSMDEHAPTKPNPAYGAYARFKLAEENQLAGAAGDTGVAWKHLRLFFLFGKYESRNRLLPHLVDHLRRATSVPLTKGEQIRDYTDIEEAAGAFVNALSVEPDTGRSIYNIGSGTGITVRDFATEVARVAGSPELLRFGAIEAPDEDCKTIVADAELARRELRWSASADTRERIRSAARWWIEHLSREGPAEYGVQGRNP